MKDINDAIKSGKTPQDLILGSTSAERGIFVLKELQLNLEKSQPKKKADLVSKAFEEESESIALAWLHEELQCHTILFTIRGYRGQGRIADFIQKQIKAICKSKKATLQPKIKLLTQTTNRDVMEKIARLEMGGDRARAEIALRYDPRWKNNLFLSEMDQCAYLRENNGLTKMLDHEERRITMSLEKDYDIILKEDIVAKMIDYVARYNEDGTKKKSYNPVREYLDGLTWDGTARLKHFMSPDEKKAYILVTENLAVDATKRDYSELGYEDDIPYITQLYGITLFLSGAARAYNIGCKQDILWTLIGEAGIDKSKLVKIIAVKKEWSSDTPIVLKSKDAYQGLRGKWWVELAEAEALHTVGAKKLKSFISSATDTYRTTFGRHAQDYDRTANFIATTNENRLEFLNDHADHRRHCVAKVDRIRLNKIIADIDQLWAEAAYYIQERNIPHWLSKDEDEVRFQHVDQYRMPDVWEQALLLWMRRSPKKNISISDALHYLRIPAQYQTVRQGRRVQTIFHTLGCKPGGKEKHGKGQRFRRTWTNPHFKPTDIPDHILDDIDDI